MVRQLIFSLRLRYNVPFQNQIENMRKPWIALVVVCGVLAGCVSAQQQKKSDSADWRKVADLFMADLVANRIDNAVERFEPELVNDVGGKQKAKAAVEQLFGYCGRPLDSEFKHEEQGLKQYVSGCRKEMRKFYYAAATNQYAKGVCFFSVEVFSGRKNWLQRDHVRSSKTSKWRASRLAQVAGMSIRVISPFHQLPVAMLFGWFTIARAWPEDRQDWQVSAPGLPRCRTAIASACAESLLVDCSAKSQMGPKLS